MCPYYGILLIYFCCFETPSVFFFQTHLSLSIEQSSVFWFHDISIVKKGLLHIRLESTFLLKFLKDLLIFSYRI